MILGGHDVTVVCPGGMMTCSSAEVMRAAGAVGTGLHTDAVLMASVAEGIAHETGLDNVGVPFCMTVEAEACGARVDLGDGRGEPVVVAYAAESLADVCADAPHGAWFSRRARAVLDAIRILSRGDRVVFGNLTGPISLLTSLVDPSLVYRLMRTDPDQVTSALDRVTEALGEFGTAMIDAGADVIMIAEPSGTGDILGERWFTQFAEEPLARLTGALALRADVVVHVCGDVRPVLSSLKRIPMSAFSFDSVVPASEVRAEWPEAVLIGNLSTQALHEREPAAIEDAAARLLSHDIDIVAPACGVAVGTPAENLRAMTRGARAGRAHVAS